VLKQQSTVTPIVFAVAIDAVRGGLVASLARPGGNLTGMSIQQSDLIGNRLELLRRAIPQFRRLAIMYDAGFAVSVMEAGDVKAAVRALGLDFASLEIRRPDDIPTNFETLHDKADALYIVSDALIATMRTRIITLALNARLPTILSYRDYVVAGGLMSYGPNFADLFGRAADMVDKVLRGAKPGEIPVEPERNLNWSSIVRPPTKSACKFRLHFWQPPTRCSNSPPFLLKCLGPHGPVSAAAIVRLRHPGESLRDSTYLVCRIGRGRAVRRPSAAPSAPLLRFGQQQPG
jgi:ABC transporter substrate binding protein